MLHRHAVQWVPVLDWPGTPARGVVEPAPVPDIVAAQAIFAAHTSTFANAKAADAFNSRCRKLLAATQECHDRLTFLACGTDKPLLGLTLAPVARKRHEQLQVNLVVEKASVQPGMAAGGGKR